MATSHVDDELRDIRAAAATVARERYAPKAAQWDLERTAFPHDERRFLGELGYLGISLPEEYGGSGAPLSHALAVIEEFAKVCRPAAFQIFESNTGPAQAIARLGTEHQKKTFLPQIVAGEKTMAVAISEPDAGSAATDMTTKAVRTDKGVVVNGMKRWISNGSEADVYLTYCRMGDAPGAKGIGAVLVEADRPGISYGAREKLMGFRGIPSADIFYDDVVVPEENIVAEAGGFRKLFGAFTIERLGNTTMSLAIGQEALDRTVTYVQERHQFGKPLVEFQSVQMTLADMVLQVEAARLLRDRAVANITDGLPDPLEVSLAKCTANEMAKRVTDMAIQLHGGNGYTEEFGIERLHRDSHGWALAGGTPTMQRTRIVSELLGRTFDQRA
ncbi:MULTISPECIES: acyl-CoA dehydrogenase family protein [Rhodococcus]|jgi:butyryl-CoA dehydrogenase|uniref:Acyl-CoA/acyl-ACP dehydrogenase n=1 Tax=Rhodococcus aetherivorans TaxID=191292 RepID=A0A059MJD0_9NOCA|nr:MULTISPECIES: acyl-CoA dehydrogenase family protein [Rhodococcus]ETT24143.1 Isovaleryl-CoA dehydrogenase [Rhodococcus rhodochrous ATCC 21198]NCL73671.1 Cyclohex-1-ene-1-carbonyl-CoA dehydrogenase [Rhodococcus sp. YH1]AKE91936.1 butyryl-CoA dehydrogenase [Rhodococcus aetherivorans]KDE11046.1 butyryl-CoA dehydrogenase [Rhodococcus aetherivorans]MBC2589883.1 acyl-CoA/acyl-ACP dehydrogenase [Rhodococcus aetherivorans]